MNIASIYQSDPDDRWDASISPWAGLSQPCTDGLCQGCKDPGCKHGCHQTTSDEETQA